MEDRTPEVEWFLNCAKAIDSLDAEYLRLLTTNATNIELRYDGTTLLHLATMRDDVMCCDALVKGGLRVNLSDNLGRTPLHVAAINGSRWAARFLIRSGAGLDLPDLEGETPLHLAFGFRQFGIAAILLMAGADRKMKNSARVRVADLGPVMPPEFRQLLVARGKVSVGELLKKHDGIDPEVKKVRRTSKFIEHHDIPLDWSGDPRVWGNNRRIAVENPKWDKESD